MKYLFLLPGLLPCTSFADSTPLFDAHIHYSHDAVIQVPPAQAADTFSPERWYYTGTHADYTRNWLKDLPPTLARKIDYENAVTMLSSRNEK